ncbi:MAG: hypothetical protein O2931_04835 [Planctomycetota bacterium]|nr:hypothetical protein [Planctomycetota bacterium]MDA1178107.1 hypothetical protein [Planctomycetota bacterium]
MAPFLLVLAFAVFSCVYGATWLLLRMLTRFSDKCIRKYASYSCMVLALVQIAGTCVNETPKAKFARYVRQPVPPSVKNIRASDFSLLQYVRVMIQCQISPADFDLIVEERGFEPTSFDEIDWLNQLSTDLLDESIFNMEPSVFYVWKDPSTFPSTILWVANQEKTHAAYVYTHDN